MIEKCEDHSGCLSDISHLKEDNKSQWAHMTIIDSRINSILTRLNVILGGIVVACILLVINVLVKVN